MDYLSCLLTVVATILVGRKKWSGLVFSGVNSMVVCVIAVHTSQYGFIPANVFCICIYAFNLKSWLNKGEQSHSDQTGKFAQMKTLCLRPLCSDSILGQALEVSRADQ